MLVLQNAFLIDGTGKEPVTFATVIVKGEKIVSVGKDIPIPEDAYVINLKGKPLLPGFSDAHSHIGGSELLERPGLGGRFETYDYSENMNTALNWGVTAVRSAGDYTPDIIKYRNDVDDGKKRSPRIIVSGRMLQAKGGHPAFTVFFSDEQVIDNACVLVDDNTDIEEEIRKLTDAGVDWIKAFLSDFNKMNDLKPVPRLSNIQLGKIAEAAHKFGKPLMVHVEDVKMLAEAVEIGADSIEHTINVGTKNHEMTEEILKLLTSRNVWIVPTMITTLKQDGSVEKAKPVYENLVTAVNQMIKSGVQIGVGCDSGVPFIPYGECVHMEMELLTSAGMSHLAAVTAATGGNSKMFRTNNVFGTVEPGKAADLVVLGNNPLEDIKNTRDVKMVIRNGSIVVDKLLAN